MLSDLEALLAALPDKRKCADVHSMKREGCPECEADDMRGRTAARRKLEAQAPALARKVLDLGSAGEALAGAVRPFVDTRVSGGKPPGLWRCPWCRQCSHQPGYIDHREDCKAAAAQSRWAELTKTEERDGT